MKTKWMVMAGLIALCGMAQAGFVMIGNAGNADDTTTGFGGVGYTYQISATEVTIAEFSAFTNATGVGGNENYWNTGTRTVGANAPASYVSLYEAMKYCNYITSGNINNGAYQFNGGGGSYSGTDRASAVTTYGTVYALPTEDEWYKAAYYKPVNNGSYSLYANGMDTVPTAGWNYYNAGYAVGDPNYVWTAGYGGAEQNGTYNMMGNVSEWIHDAGGMVLVRGGSFGRVGDTLSSSYSDSMVPGSQFDDVGFRVVAIPEPASAMLVFFGAGVGVVIHRARRSALRR
jgi:sulfatase modifying factor 1